MSKNILVVAAHPDDEVLGAGATIARHARKGDNTYVVYTADGEGARGHLNSLEARKTAARKAASILGVKETFFLDFPDNRLDTVSLLDVTQAIEKIIDDISPSRIYTHYPRDLNIDHELTARAVLTACRPQPGIAVKEVLAFETLSNTEWSGPLSGLEFSPNYFVNCAETLDLKIEALRCYEAEMRDFPHPRSYEGVKALALYRGVQAGYTSAEAFQILRFLHD